MWWLVYAHDALSADWIEIQAEGEDPSAAETDAKERGRAIGLLVTDTFVYGRFANGAPEIVEEELEQ